MSLLLRLTLSLVFAIAGMTKFVDLHGSREAARNFGIPERVSKPLGTILPFAELAIAVALLFAETAWWAAVGALTLLSLFVIGITINLVRGRRPDCHCFGNLHSAPIGRQTLVRNGLLLVLAVFIVLRGSQNIGPSVTHYFTGITTLQIVGIILAMLVLAFFLLESWFIVQLMQQQGRLLMRIEALEITLANSSSQQAKNLSEHGLAVGSLAPSFALSDINGETITLDKLRASHKPLLLLFADPGCGPCNVVMSNIARWQREYEHIVLVIISRGDAQQNRAKSVEFGFEHLILQQDHEIAQKYQVQGTPSAVLVRADGTIGSPVVLGPEAISVLLLHTTEQMPLRTQ